MRVLLNCVSVLLAMVCGATAIAHAQEPKAVLLLAATSEQGTITTFGRGANESGPLARSVIAPFEKAGVSMVSSQSASVSELGGDHGLPMNDSAAIEMARMTGANIAIVVGIQATDDGSLRATDLFGQSVAARVRVLDVATEGAVFDGRGRSASYAPEATVARSQASAGAVARATRGLLPELARRWPTRRQRAGQLSLTIRGADSWRVIATIIRSLSATRGVSGVHALEIRPERIVLSLRSLQGAAQVVAGLRRARIPNGSLSVQLSERSLDVRIMMNNSSILPSPPNG